MLDQQVATLATYTLLCNTVAYWIQFLSKLSNLAKFNRFLTICSGFLLASSLSLRWYTEGYFPLSNLYESLLFLSVCLVSGYLIIEKNVKSKIIGVLVSPLCFFIVAFATFILPNDMQKSLPLVPSLQSDWLMMHVSMMMLSYAVLMLGSLLCIFYYAISKLQLGQQNLLTNLDIWSYRTIGLGFPFLTIGIIAGAVWANEAWGTYWSWDPKETWALITWLSFATYLHARIVKGWEGEKVAVIGSISFVIVWVCYLGVNFLGKGLHSYGWVS